MESEAVEESGGRETETPAPDAGKQRFRLNRLGQGVVVAFLAVCVWSTMRTGSAAFTLFEHVYVPWRAASAGLVSGLIVVGVVCAFSWCWYRIMRRSQFVGNALATTLLSFFTVAMVLIDLSAPKPIPPPRVEVAQAVPYETTYEFRAPIVDEFYDEYELETKRLGELIHQQLAERNAALERIRQGAPGIEHVEAYLEAPRQAHEATMTFAAHRSAIRDLYTARLIERGVPRATAESLGQHLWGNPTEADAETDRQARMTVELCEAFVKEATFLHDHFGELAFDPEHNAWVMPEHLIEVYRVMQERMLALAAELLRLDSADPADGE